MRYFQIIQMLCCIAAGALLGACSTFDFDIPSKKVDYKSAGKLPSLEVPPDLTRPTADDRYAIPDSRKGAATYSNYTMDKEWRQQTGAAVASAGVLPEQSDARVERAGTQRWLVVKGDPALVWPVVKDFWQEVGFIVNVEAPEAGVMETDWNENRAKVSDGVLRGLLGKVLDSAYATAERDKFRTRLERSTQSGMTEIYISHRGMQEIYITEGKDQTRWPAGTAIAARRARREPSAVRAYTQRFLCSLRAWKRTLAGRGRPWPPGARSRHIRYRVRVTPRCAHARTPRGCPWVRGSRSPSPQAACWWTR